MSLTIDEINTMAFFYLMKLNDIELIISLFDLDRETCMTPKTLSPQVVEWLVETHTLTEKEVKLLEQFVKKFIC